MVAPNSPTLRAKARIAPARRPGAISGRVMVSEDAQRAGAQACARRLRAGGRRLRAKAHRPHHQRKRHHRRGERRALPGEDEGDAEDVIEPGADRAAAAEENQQRDSRPRPAAGPAADARSRRGASCRESRQRASEPGAGERRQGRLRIDADEADAQAEQRAPRVSRGVSENIARQRAALSRSKPALEIGDEIVHVLEPGMEAQHRPVAPRHRGAQPLGMDRQDQALEPAPARAHAEKLHAVEHGGDAAAWRCPRCSTTAKRPLAPVKSRRHSAWPGSSGRPGWSTRSTSGRSASQRASASPCAWCCRSRTPARAQAAQRQVAIVGRGVIAELGRGVAHRQETLLGADRDAHHRVGMADDVFRRRDHLDIDAQRQRLEEERRRPGVVDDRARRRAPSPRRRSPARPAPRR